MKLNDLFSDGVIFQANKPIRIFGTGGGKLKIRLCDSEIQREIVAANWVVELPPMQYGGPYCMTVNLDGRESIIQDIYIGDVYILAGQSNMQFKLFESDCSKELYKNNNLLRLFSSERPDGGEKFFPQDGWVIAEKDNVGDWSSLGYMVGMMLQEKNHHAVGLITCYQGAADIQSYLPDYVFKNQAFNIPITECFDNQFIWNKEHSFLFYFQTKRIIPFSAAGVVWYQGESNYTDKESEIYGEMLSALINSWRMEFKDEILPFVVVQIADNDDRNGRAWHEIQRAQVEIQDKEPYVKSVICRDICESADIHPRSKFKLAERIANAIYLF